MPTPAVTISRIVVYPFKSLDGFDVQETAVLPNGALQHDRRFAMIDADGRFINGKRFPDVHRIRSRYDLAAGCFWFRREGDSVEAAFHWPQDKPRLEAWLGGQLKTAVSVAENRDGGFPDDSDSPGLTVVGVESLDAVGRWFELPQDEVHRRFRANIAIRTPCAFWEDRLAGEKQRPVTFALGVATLRGTNPCQRCVVPTRDARTGDATSRFQSRFAEYREESFPCWAPLSRFDHFYRFAVNTCGVRPGVIRVGDELTIAEPDPHDPPDAAARSAGSGPA